MASTPSRTDGAGGFALSAAGTLVFRPQPPPAHRTLVWADRSGVTTPIPIEPRAFWTPRLSPDGQQFAVVIDEQGRRNIWVYRFDNATFLPIASEGTQPRAGVDTGWVASRLSVRARRRPPSHVAAKRLERACRKPAHEPERLISFLAAGRQTVVRSSTSTARRLAAPSFASCRSTGVRSRRLPDIPADSNRPAISPDGRWLAFGIAPSEASGRPAIYVRPFPGPGPSRQFVDAAGQPVWSQDGEKIFFRSRRGAPPTYSGDGIFEMPFDRSRGIAAGPERQLFRKGFAEDAWMGVAGYDVAPTVDSCWSSPTNRSPAPSTCTCCFTSTTSSDGVSGP